MQFLIVKTWQMKHMAMKNLPVLKYSFLTRLCALLQQIKTETKFIKIPYYHLQEVFVFILYDRTTNFSIEEPYFNFKARVVLLKRFLPVLKYRRYCYRKTVYAVYWLDSTPAHHAPPRTTSCRNDCCRKENFLHRFSSNQSSNSSLK